MPTSTSDDTTRRILVVFIALMLGNGMSALDTTMVATAVPTIVGDLGGLRDLSWIATAYLLTSLSTMPLYGKLGDMYGRKKIFLVAVGLFLTGSVLCGAAQSMTQLIVFRALQGLGAGGLISLPMATIADLVSPRQLGRWIGYSGFVFAFATAAGPLFGGLFADHLSWRWAFYINVPIGLLSVLLVTRLLHLPPRRTEHRVDYPGAALIAGAVACVVLLTSLGGSREPWGSPPIIGLGVAAVVLVILLVARERVAAEPVLPPRLFAASIPRVCLAMNAIAGLVFYSGLYFFSAFLQFVNGVSPTSSGTHLIPFTVATVITTMLVGRLMFRTGRYRLYPIIGSALVTLGFALVIGVDVDSSPGDLLIGAVVIGLGLGMIMQVLILAIQNAVERRDVGIATASSMFSRQLGGTIGLAVLGSVFTNRLAHFLREFTPRSAHLDVDTLKGRPETLGHLSREVRHGVTDAFAHSLHTLFLILVPLGVVVFLLSLRLRELPLREHVGEHPGDDLAIALEGAAPPPMVAVAGDGSCSGGRQSRRLRE